MTEPNDLFFTPVNLECATVLLGHIQYVIEQPFDSYKEKWPAPGGAHERKGHRCPVDS